MDAFDYYITIIIIITILEVDTCTVPDRSVLLLPQVALFLVLFRCWGRSSYYYSVVGFKCWDSDKAPHLTPLFQLQTKFQSRTTPRLPTFYFGVIDEILYGGTVQHCNALDRLRMQITNMFQARKIAGKGVTLTLPCPMISSRRDTDCSV